MIVVYRPEQGDEQSADTKRLLSSEAEAVESVTGLTWAEVIDGLAKGSPRCMRAIAWVGAKRADPTLRYRDFDPLWTSLTVDADAEERALLRTEAERQRDRGELTEEEFAQALEALADPEDSGEEQAPKDPAGESDTAA